MPISPANYAHNHPNGRKLATYRFSAAREELLLEWVPAFLAIESDPVSRRRFWECLFADYWGTFCWSWSIEEDPEPSTQRASEMVSQTQALKRNAVMKQTQGRIRGFMHYQKRSPHRQQVREAEAAMAAAALEAADAAAIAKQIDAAVAFVAGGEVVGVGSGVERKARRSRTINKKSGNDDDAPKKRGNPGDFHGKREEFLREHLEEYIAASEARGTRTFWPTLFGKWWALFPWTLPIEKDSTDGIELDTRPDTALSDDERAQKRAVLDAMETKIKSWYNYQRAHHGGGAKNPWAPLLKELRDNVNAPAPKRLADFQCYMQRPEYKEEIQRLFEERHPDKIRGRGTINERAAIARELLAAESVEVKKKIHELADAEHEEEMKDWRATKNGTKELTEEEKEAARARWAVTIAPLLKILSDYTGYKISMIVGQIDKTTWKFDIRSLHEGKTAKGDDWPTWAADGAYNDHVVRQFMRFLLAEEGAVVPSDRVGDDPLEILRLAGVAAAAAGPSGPSTSTTASSSGPNTVTTSNPATRTAIPSIPPAPTAATPPRAVTPTPALPDRPATPALHSRPPTPTPIELAPFIPQVRAAPAPSELDGVEGVEDALKRQVQALPPDQRVARIEQLKQMPVFFRRRDSNIAMHAEEEDDAKAELEAQAAKAAAEKQAAKEKKRKAPTKRTRKGRTKRRRRGPMGLDASDEELDEPTLESDSSEDDEHGTPTPTPTPTPKPVLLRP
ncbi:hypothetical protein C8F04DRAFT_1239615 [Mycena alexandri]|uniref:Uncharacterized protein n=1 Tax=Mycena alexandri TaxID=1745969 RepID=A0AAD6WT77_9AGAR|nr:hypothetical protein C8F04DRAFT_1239615 [Mycena alexandri]